ncbi:uncharacterized protein LOC105914782 [Setaria italica]|nr:uncharacterized protein LOC105914782 [Setaria italica]
MGTRWAEEAVPAPTQSVANGMFQGVAWSQQPAGQQLLNHQERAGHLPAGQQQLRHQELEVRFPADQQPRYLEQAVAVPLPAGQQLRYQQEQDLPGMLQLRYQQQPLHLPAEQQLLYYQEQLMANGGFQGAPLALAAGLTSGNTMIGSWPLSQGGIGRGQEQQAGPPRQQWPGAGADPSPSCTLPGGEQLGNQNLHSSNAGIHERPR